MARTMSVLLALCLSACGTNPADCYDKGNEQACNDLCNTGKEENLMACYELRARAVAACADGKGDCARPCEAWVSSESMDQVRGFYVAKLGSEDKVAAINTKCGPK
jgi:hypothetical protein